MKFPCTNPFENSSKTRISLYLLRFSPDCHKYGHDKIHISIGTHLCENIKNISPVIFSRNSSARTSLYLIRFSPDCPKYGRDKFHISIGTHLCENIKNICPVIFSRNSCVQTPLRIRQNSNFIISVSIQSRLPQIWS